MLLAPLRAVNDPLPSFVASYANGGFQRASAVDVAIEVKAGSAKARDPPESARVFDFSLLELSTSFCYGLKWLTGSLLKALTTKSTKTRVLAEMSFRDA
ncbi:hypothetical protein B0G80_5011 [Paraburkholderia sp. BL6669N2]|nr:hypothetical protein B0G80_5011 [Paraburkholderia sp. BL6669N2]